MHPSVSTHREGLEGTHSINSYITVGLIWLFFFKNVPFYLHGDKVSYALSEYCNFYCMTLPELILMFIKNIVTPSSSLCH